MIQVEVKTAKGINISVAEGKGITVPIVAKVLASMGGGGGTGIPSGGVTSDLIADYAVTKQKLEQDVQNKIDSVPILSGKLNSLFWSQATFGMSANPTTIYANTNTSVTFTSTFTSSSIDAAEVDEIRITSDSDYNAIVASSKKAKTATYTEAINLAAGKSKKLYSKVAVGTNTKTSSVTVAAYNKMYYGSLGSVPSKDTFTSLTLIAASNTAKSKTLTFTSKENGHAFYLAVPVDVTQPTGCTNASGVSQGFTYKAEWDFVSNDGISYKVYRLGGASYDKGVSFTFKTV